MFINIYPIKYINVYITYVNIFTTYNYLLVIRRAQLNVKPLERKRSENLAAKNYKDATLACLLI